MASEAESDDVRRVTEASARVGTTLRGKWKLDALLGLGGMAAVYAATHRNGMRGAVKILDPIVGRNDAMRERFLREGYLANSVNHSSAVLVLDDDTTEDGHVYLVMELLDGSTLEELASASGGKLSPREVLDAMAQVLDALSHAHARGIVHRDIKPDNLFVTKGGLVKVLDFGIAGLLEAEIALSVTQTGSPMGTPAFMSPEQARGRAKLVDAQSDVYSVGATMFTLLTGELVHGSETTISEYVAATFTTQARPIRSIAPEVPEPIAGVVDRALRLNKAERWPSAAHMLGAVREAYKSVFDEEMAPPPVAAPRVSRTSLMSLHEVRSITPMTSSNPRVQSDSATTLPPPAMAVSQARKAPGRGRLLAAVAAVGFVLAIAFVAFRVTRETPSASTTAQPPVQQHEIAAETHAANAAPPPPTVTAAIANATKPVETQAPAVKPLATTKGVAKALASASASAAPSASAPPAPTVNVYDRRY